jgi:glutathionylspermidine synthase
VDVAGSPSVPEFRIICDAARQAGIDALHATLDDVEYDGSLLRVQGEPVHLVYRRALLEDLPEGDLIAAARDRRAAVVNPFRARVANNKKLFALLADPRFSHLVVDSERAVIAETIPWTRVLREGREHYGDWVVDLLAFVSDNRERLVMKPASDYGGHGVSLGMETEQAEWDRLIEEHHAAGDYVVQEYVPVPEEMFPTVEGGHVQMRLKRFNINPFGIGGRYAGMITRISDQAVINVSAGGGLLPSVVGRHREPLLAEESADDETAWLRR